jgi:hypothetical protein
MTAADDGARARRGSSGGAPRPKGPWLLADRGLVLLIGVGVGVVIGLAFHRGDSVKVAAAAPPAIPPPKHAAAAVQDCALPLAPRLVADLRAGRPAVVGVIGDSFGDGVWGALYRRMARKDVRVVKMSQEGTGFTRYQVVNVEAETERQLREQPLDVAILVFGANDTEGIWDDAHRHAYPFMSAPWQEIYGRRLARVVQRLREQQAIVYWVGLPKMRKPQYDADVAAENAFYAVQARTLGIPYFDTRALSADDKGDFDMYLMDARTGSRRLMRAGDGIHMTAAGYERMTAPVEARIDAYLARAAADAAIARATPAPIPKSGEGA